MISDTHGKHRSIRHVPAGDILIHAGDITNAGSGPVHYDEEEEDVCRVMRQGERTRVVALVSECSRFHDRSVHDLQAN